MTQALMDLWKETPLIYPSSTLQASNSRYVPSVFLNSYLLSVMGRSRIDGVRDVPGKPDAIGAVVYWVVSSLAVSELAGTMVCRMMPFHSPNHSFLRSAFGSAGDNRL